MEEKELSTTISASPVNSESDAAVTQQPPTSGQDDVFENNNVGNNNTTTNNNNNMGIATTEGLSFVSTTTTAMSFSQKEKKKRGRPRKYDADGNLRVPYTSPQTTPFSLSSSSDQFSSLSSNTKKGRGRLSASASASGNWLLASCGEIFANTAGGDFTPHVVTVSTGEDVGGKIISFAQNGERGICVLSANGAVSNVTLRQPGSSGGTLTYEGRFEILSLTGSFTMSEMSGGRSRTGGLSVSLAGPDGRVIGGGLAGLLTAASPIQIVVGSFMPNGYKIQKRKYHREHHNHHNVASQNRTIITSDTLTFATPISQAKPPPPLVNSVPEPPPTTTTTLMPPQQPPMNLVFSPPTEQKLTPTISSTTTTIDNKENPSNGAPPNFATWNGSDLIHAHRSPDINISVSGDS